jgi:dTDP-L-rhamnose 4-epimerase
MMTSRTLLITGGLGFTGLYLANILHSEDINVQVFDIRPRPSWFTADIKYLQGNVTEKESWLRALDGVDYVIHLAVYPGYYQDYSTYIQVNTASTALLYEVIAENKLPIKKVIVASSQAVYGEGKYRCPEHGIFYPERRTRENLEQGRWDIYCPQDNLPAEVLPSEESDKLGAVSMYGVSKIAADHTARLLGYHHNIPTVVVRNSHVIGAHPHMNSLYTGSLPSFVEQTLKGGPVILNEDGNQLRDLLNIKDLGHAYKLLLKHQFDGCYVINIGAGGIRLKELAEKVCATAGVPFRPIFKTEPKPWAYRHWVLSHEKINLELGWKPKYTIEQGINEYLEAAKK